MSFLGLTIDSRLDWGEHTEKLCLCLARYNYALKILSVSVSRDVAMMAYHAFVQSRISYGIIFWGNTSHIKRVLLLQKRCLRSVFGMTVRESCKPVFQNHKILTAVGLYIMESSLFIKKNTDLFSECLLNHNYNTRNMNDLQPSSNKYQYLQKNVEFSIKKIWNKIPMYIRSLPMTRFRSKLKTILVSRAYYATDEFFNDNLLLM